MNRIVIIGRSVAAWRMVEQIRRLNRESEIVLFAQDGGTPVKAEALAGWLSGKIPVEQIADRPMDFLESQNVRLIEDRKVQRINTRKGIVVADDKEAFAYEGLVITGAPCRRLRTLPGMNKTGVVDPGNFADLAALARDAVFMETAAVQCGTPQALRLACALKDLGKDVLLICPSTSVLPSFLDPVSDRLVREALEESGIRVIDLNGIQEILGDADVKAVKLTSGKVISCQKVILSADQPDLRFLKDALHWQDDRIPVNIRFETSAQQVYAVGPVCSFGLDRDIYAFDNAPAVIDRQAGRVAAQLAGHEEPGGPWPVMKAQMQIGGQHFTLLGQTYGEGRSLAGHLPEEAQKPVEQKVFVQNRRIVGGFFRNRSDRMAAVQAGIQGRQGFEELFPEVPAQDKPAE